MPTLVDVVTGAEPPKYTTELLRGLPKEFEVRYLRSKGYAPSQVGTLWRLVDHPRSVRRARRSGSILYVDSQLLAYVLSSRLAAPTVVTCYDLLQFRAEHDDPSYVSRRGFHRLYYRRLRRGLERAGRVVAVSEFVRSELLGIGLDPRRIMVVPMGVDLDRYRPRAEAECRAIRARYGIPQDRPVVLFVGTEHPRKNAEGLFRALARLDDPVPFLVKVGAPRQPQRGQLLRLAHELALEDRVRFLDRVPEEDLPTLDAAADVLVLPSFYEGFGLPPLEAMACGTPVAVSRTSSLPEVVGDAGAYFDPRDEGTIADTLRSVLTDRDLRKELSARGRERAAQFPWARSSAAFAEVLRAAPGPYAEKDLR